MCIDQGRLDVFVAQELLNEADVGTAIEQVGRKTVSKYVRSHLLFDVCQFSRFLNDILYALGTIWLTRTCALKEVNCRFILPAIQMQSIFEHLAEHHHAIFFAFGLPDQYLRPLPLDVFQLQVEQLP